jgi:hypothetical protein
LDVGKILADASLLPEDLLYWSSDRGHFRIETKVAMNDRRQIKQRFN